jgi:asparagine synthase (glutamine-hydrolysing)
MILGILDRDRRGSDLTQDLLRVTARTSQGAKGIQATVYADWHLALCSIPLQIGTLDEAPQPFINEDQTIVVMCEGKIYNTAEIRRLLGSNHRFRTDCAGEAFAHLYARYGEGFLDQVNGKFAFALWDGRNHKLLLGRDRLGIEPLFYFNDGKRFAFSSSLRGLLATGWVSRQLNDKALLQYLLYCYNPGDETFLKGVYKVPPGHLLTLDASGMTLKRYWRLSFAETEIKTEEEYREEILGLIEDAIRIRMDPDRPAGILLSGGTDSSTIVSLASRMSRKPLYTFSFRCEGRSYDESRYARLIAQRYGTEHTEIPYRQEHLRLIFNVVESMDEPFCDIGIEIGTYLLGRAAEGKVSYVLSGEGGDELFGGHPVYVADKVVALVDRLPRFLTAPVAGILQSIPDSDQKKNLQVKLKRFAYSLSFPPELLSHRWRVYYTPRELKDLCTEDILASADEERLFEGMVRYSREADGRDRLSRSLYSDYHTLVSFYLRRLGLLRSFSVESRLPLLDYGLVEYAARIPSRMKVRGYSDTKYIYKKVLEGVLPREILYDRPKLGHSVPMKNWLRSEAKLPAWMAEILSDVALKRSFFCPSVIPTLIEEHLNKSHNHSHRLWALIVLELWLRAWLDQQAPLAISPNPAVPMGAAIPLE